MSFSTFVFAAQLAAAQPASGDVAPPVLEPAAALPASPAAPSQPVAEVPPVSAADASAPAPAEAEADDSVVVTARPAPPPEDPMQALNVESFQVVQSVDEAVTGPVARGYKSAVPSPVRSGLRNFLSNLQEPVVFLNYLLQFKPGKAAETLGRFTINSTIGGVGLFDVAKKEPFRLPRRPNGFGYTLGYYGVKPGPFMYLPLIGPTTLRDLVGRVGDLSVMPAAIGSPFNQPLYAIPTTVIRLVDERAEADEAIQALRDSPEDSYSTVRERYLRQREAEIEALHGRTPVAPPVPALPALPAPAGVTTPVEGNGAAPPAL